MSFMYKTMMNRAPNKRKIKINEENLLRLMTNSDDEDEEDEDFTVSSEKEKNQDGVESDSEDDSAESSDDEEKIDSNSEAHETVENTDQPGSSSRVRKNTKRRSRVTVCPTVKDLRTQITSEYYGLPSSTVEILMQAKKQFTQSENAVNNMDVWPDSVCGVCYNEEHATKSSKMTMCQKCGISVHESCYNIQHHVTKKNNPDSLWICDACVYGGSDVVCQFCPNLWGCMKETKCGRWVHVVCARNILTDFLYNSPGTSRRSEHTKGTLYIQLNDFNSKQYGSKECILCEDRLVAKTGICIKCDAGLCKSTFHVTCAQRHGLLSKVSGSGYSNASHPSGETHFANCPLHCDKEEIKKRQRRFILQLKTSESRRKKFEDRNSSQQDPVTTKLHKLREMRKRHSNSFVPPRPPLEQIPRMLSSDAHFTRLLNDKAEKMFGITTRFPATIIPKATEIRKRHYVAPTLTTDFAAYYLDRDLRIEEEKSTLSSAMKTNRTLSNEQEYERLKHNEIRNSLIACKSNRSDQKKEYDHLKQCFTWIFDWASSGQVAKTGARRRKSLTPRKMQPSRELSLSPSPPTSIKEQIPDAELIIELNSCGICKGQENQHLLVRCDVCLQWQHLGCLDPPLTQMPKRTKFSLWQCSECAETSGSSSSDSDPENRGTFTSQDGRRLTRRFRRAPDKLAVGFPDSPAVRIAKGMISDSKVVKKQKYFQDALKTVTKAPHLQEPGLAETSARSETSPHTSPQKGEPHPWGTPTIPLGISCDNYLSHAARIPIINEPKTLPTYSATRQMKKIIILKKSIAISNHRPLGLGQARKQFVVPKKESLTVQIPIKSELNVTQKASRNLRMRLCSICGVFKSDRRMVTCDTCKKHYHWKCCDPQLNSNPVTKFVLWECSSCVNEREGDVVEEEEDESDKGSTVTPEGRRVISRKRKPPEVFEPAFNIPNQQKIFKFHEKKKKRRAENPKSGAVSENIDLPTTMTAARCRPLVRTHHLGHFPQTSSLSTMPMKVLKTLKHVNLSGFKSISIIKKKPGEKPSIINLIPHKISNSNISHSNPLARMRPTVLDFAHIAKDKMD